MERAVRRKPFPAPSPAASRRQRSPFARVCAERGAAQTRTHGGGGSRRAGRSRTAHLVPPPGPAYGGGSAGLAGHLRRDRRNGNAARILARTRGTTAKLERGHRRAQRQARLYPAGGSHHMGARPVHRHGPGVLLDGDGRARFGLSVRGRGRHHRSPPPHADCPGQPCGTAGARPGRHRSARPAHRRRVQRSASLLDGRPRRFGQRDTRPGAGRGVVLQSRRARSFSVAGFHGHGFGQHTR